MLSCWQAWSGQAPLLAEEKPGYDDTPMLPDSQWRVHDRNRPQAPIVEPGAKPGDPPSDAIVLFDGRDTSQWERPHDRGDRRRGHQRRQDSRAQDEAGVRRLPAPHRVGHAGRSRRQFHELGATAASSSRVFTNCRLSSRRRAISMPTESRAPSTASSRRWPTHRAGPGQWQTFDAVFQAPRFEGEKLVEPARMDRLLERRARPVSPEDPRSDKTQDVSRVRSEDRDRPAGYSTASLGGSIAKHLDPTTGADGNDERDNVEWNSLVSRRQSQQALRHRSARGPGRLLPRDRPGPVPSDWQVRRMLLEDQKPEWSEAGYLPKWTVTVEEGGAAFRIGGGRAR